MSYYMTSSTRSQEASKGAVWLIFSVLGLLVDINGFAFRQQREGRYNCVSFQVPVT